MIKKILFNKIIPKIHKFYLSVNLKITEFTPEEGEKCLCLAPHADDESIGCGGILSLYPKNFDVICLTDGRKGVKSVSVEEAIKIRKNEFSNAMTSAGVNSFQIFNAEDKHLIEYFEQFRTIPVEKYDYIFIPNMLDQHPDHKAVSLLLKRLIDKTKHKSNLKIAFYEVWTTLALPNAFVDITSVKDKKAILINSHRSQVEQKNYTQKALALNEYRGLQKNRDFAEAFCIVDVPVFKKMCDECI